MVGPGSRIPFNSGLINPSPVPTIAIKGPIFQVRTQNPSTKRISPIHSISVSSSLTIPNHGLIRMRCVRPMTIYVLVLNSNWETVIIRDMALLIPPYDREGIGNVSITTWNSSFQDPIDSYFGFRRKALFEKATIFHEAPGRWVGKEYTGICLVVNTYEKRWN